LQEQHYDAAQEWDAFESNPPPVNEAKTRWVAFRGADLLMGDIDFFKVLCFIFTQMIPLFLPCITHCILQLPLLLYCEPQLVPEKSMINELYVDVHTIIVFYRDTSTLQRAHCMA